MKKVALALFPFIQDLKDDLEGTLLHIKKLGFDGVEFAFGLYYEPNYLRRVLHKIGLEIVGWHIDIDYIREELFEAVVNYMTVVGNKRLIVPGLPDYMTDSKKSWSETADEFNFIAKRLYRYGIALGYHNHQKEFFRVGSSYIFDEFCEKTQGRVFLQLDVGNMLSAAADPISFLKKYSGRFSTIHLKPYSFERGFCTMIGEDSIDYKDIIDNLNEYGIEWMIIEYETQGMFEKYAGAKECLDRLRTMIL